MKQNSQLTGCYMTCPHSLSSDVTTLVICGAKEVPPYDLGRAYCHQKDCRIPHIGLLTSEKSGRTVIMRIECNISRILWHFCNITA